MDISYGDLVRGRSPNRTMIIFNALEIDESISELQLFNAFLIEAYETSLLINSESGLFTILSEKRLLLPKSIRVSDEEFKYLRTNLLNNNFDDLTVVSKNVINLSVMDLFQNNRNCIKESEKIIKFYQKENYNYYSKINKIVLKLIDEVKKGEISGQYLGYGIGTTPTMDDVILGGLIISYVNGNKEIYKRLENYVLRNIDLTTKVSGYQFDNFITHKLIPKVFKELLVKQTLRNALDCIKHGSSSGLDVLIGMVMFYENLLI